MAKAKLAAPKAAKKTSIGRILSAVVGLSALIALPLYTADRMMDWGITVMFGYGVPYRTKEISTSWVDHFHSKNIEILTEGAPINIGLTRIEAPAPWVLSTIFLQGILQPRLNHLKINFEDIVNPDGYELNSEAFPIGPRSTAFAELEGCGGFSKISDRELTELGLTIGNTSMSYEINIQGDQVTAIESFSTPGLGHATFTRIGSGSRIGDDLYFSDGLPSRVMWKTNRWEFNDEGFIHQRNIFCARETGVSIEQFLANHLASIDRVMASLGVDVSPEMREMYLDYATNGGKISFSGDFVEEIPNVATDIDDFGPQMLTLKGEMQRDGRRVYAGFKPQRQRPFSEVDDELTTYEVLKREGVSVDPLTLPEPGAFAQAAAANANATAVTPDDDSASETMVVKVKVDPLVSSEVISVPDEDPVFITNFDQIANLVGRKIRIERRARPVMVATVLGRGKLGLRLRVSIASGFAEIEVARGEFIRAQVYPIR